MPPGGKAASPPAPSKTAAAKPAPAKPPPAKPASTPAPQAAQKPMLEEDPFDFLGLGDDVRLELIDEPEQDNAEFKKAAHDA
jgi:hypothetical protein